MRKLSNIATWGFEYGQEALVATVKVTVPVSEQSRGDGNSTAWQKYLPTGPLALLPLWGGYSSVVWSTSVAEARRLQALPNEQVCMYVCMYVCVLVVLCVFLLYPITYSPETGWDFHML